jgi:hypothetical protein
MAAVIQALGSIGEFVEILSCYRKRPDEDFLKSVPCLLQAVLYGLGTSEKPFPITQFMAAFRESVKSRVFSGQQDADEFFSMLLERLENAFDEDQRERMQRLFHFVEVTRHIASDGTVKQECPPEFGCSLDIPVPDGGSDLATIFLARVKGAEVEGIPDVRRSTRFKKPPLVLWVHQLLFRGQPIRKFVAKVEFPRVLDLAPYCDEPPAEQLWYDLAGVIVHIGTIAGGHYAAYLLKPINGRQRWVCFDDDSVAEDTWETVAKTCGNSQKTAYCLMYTRRGLAIGESITFGATESTAKEYFNEMLAEQARQEDEAGRVTLKVFRAGACAAKGTTLLIATETIDLRLRGDDPITKLIQACAEAYQLPPDGIRVWKCDRDVPQSILRPKELIRTLSFNSRLFVEELNDRPPGLLVFLKFFTQNLEDPITDLGCYSVPMNATPRDLFHVVPSEELLVFHEMPSVAVRRVHPIEPSTALESTGKSMVHFLTFQEPPRCDLPIKEIPGVRDSSEFCPSEREATYKNFIDREFNAFTAQIAEHTRPDDVLLNLRIRECSCYIRGIIAAAAGIRYDAQKEALLLFLGQTLLPTEFVKCPKICFRLIRSYSDEEVSRLDKIDVGLDAFSQPSSSVPRWLRPHTTPRDIIESLALDGYIPDGFRAHIFTSLTECKSDDAVTAQSKLKVYVLPDESDGAMRLVEVHRATIHNMKQKPLGLALICPITPGKSLAELSTVFKLRPGEFVRYFYEIDGRSVSVDSTAIAFDTLPDGATLRIEHVRGGSCPALNSSSIGSPRGSLPRRE